MLKLFKRLAAALLVLGVLLVASYVFRAPLLRASADFWIVNQSVTNADSIVVLGGGLQTRPFFAAKLFQEGLATRILLMNVKPDATTELGLTPTEQELTRTHWVAGVTRWGTTIPCRRITHACAGVRSAEGSGRTS